MVLRFSVVNGTIKFTFSGTIGSEETLVDDESICLPYDRNDGCEVDISTSSTSGNESSEEVGQVLTDWKLPVIKKLKIKTRYIAECVIAQSTLMVASGISAHTSLEEFCCMNSCGVFLGCLTGFEFLHRLSVLDISNQMVSDLSPIKDLPLSVLEIYCCPITTMRDIPYSSLRQLSVDVDQLEILMEENIDLPSTLEDIKILGPRGVLDHPSVVRFLETYHFRHAPSSYDGRRLNVRLPRQAWYEYNLGRV